MAVNELKHLHFNYIAIHVILSVYRGLIGSVEVFPIRTFYTVFQPHQDTMGRFSLVLLQLLLLSHSALVCREVPLFCRCSDGRENGSCLP